MTCRHGIPDRQQQPLRAGDGCGCFLVRAGIRGCGLTHDFTCLGSDSRSPDTSVYNDTSNTFHESRSASA